jgi:hypothetical protein
MQVRMLGAKLSATEAHAQRREAAVLQLSLARSRQELALDALEKQRSSLAALEASLAAGGACTPVISTACLSGVRCLGCSRVSDACHACLTRGIGMV